MSTLWQVSRINIKAGSGACRYVRAQRKAFSDAELRSCRAGSPLNQYNVPVPGPSAGIPCSCTRLQALLMHIPVSNAEKAVPIASGKMTAWKRKLVDAVSRMNAVLRLEVHSLRGGPVVQAST